MPLRPSQQHSSRHKKTPTLRRVPSKTRGGLSIKELNITIVTLALPKSYYIDSPMRSVCPGSVPVACNCSGDFTGILVDFGIIQDLAHSSIVRTIYIPEHPSICKIKALESKSAIRIQISSLSRTNLIKPTTVFLLHSVGWCNDRVSQSFTATIYRTALENMNVKSVKGWLRIPFSRFPFPNPIYFFQSILLFSNSLVKYNILRQFGHT